MGSCRRDRNFYKKKKVFLFNGGFKRFAYVADTNVIKVLLPVLENKARNLCLFVSVTGVLLALKMINMVFEDEFTDNRGFREELLFNTAKIGAMSLLPSCICT